MNHHVEASRTVPGTPEEVYDAVIPAPLPSIFKHRHVVMPPIARVSGQEGTWGETVGQTRRIHLADGGSMVETLTVVSPPSQYGYRIDRVRGPLKPLAKEIRGLWSFAPVGSGTKVAWRWEIEPTLVARPLMPVFAAMWRGYAARSLERLSDLL